VRLADQWPLRNNSVEDRGIVKIGLLRLHINGAESRRQTTTNLKGRMLGLTTIGNE
jgi:hypothetical protein